MSNTERLDPIELVRQAKNAGLLDSMLTIKCVHCNALFPKEYYNCPQCKTNEI